MRRRLVFAIPGDLFLPTGGYAYDRRMIAELESIGWTVEVLPLGADFPLPEEGSLRSAGEALAALEDGTLVLLDGLAFGAMPQIAEKEAARLKLVALVHHPLALETGLDDAAAARLKASETRALTAARAVVATSPATARALTVDYAVPEKRLSVAPPGTDPAPVSLGDGVPPMILSVGAIVPRKGHDMLVGAMARLSDLEWRCRIVGALDRDPAHAARVGALIAEKELGRRIALPGPAPDARAEMAEADIFVLPTLHEGYGMVFAEAMSQGLPVVGCRVGAVPEVVPDAAGLLVPPGDVVALGEAIRALLFDPDLRRRKREGALAAAATLPTWAASGRLVSNALEEAAR